jgi:hypothetical protein
MSLLKNKSPVADFALASGGLVAHTMFFNVQYGHHANKRYFIVSAITDNLRGSKLWPREQWEYQEQYRQITSFL